MTRKLQKLLKNLSYWFNIKLVTYVIIACKLVCNISLKIMLIFENEFCELVSSNHWLILRKLAFVFWAIWPWCSLIGKFIERNTLASFFFELLLLWISLPFLENFCYLSRTVAVSSYSLLHNFYIPCLSSYKRFWTIFYTFIFVCLHKVTVTLVDWFKNNDLKELWAERNTWTKNLRYIFT